MANKKMTLSYWNSLSRGSKYRALCFVFGPHQCLANIYADEKPNLKDGMWKLIFKKIHIPEDHSHYKTCVNQTYVP